MSAEDILGAMGEPNATGAPTPPPLERAEDSDFQYGTVSLLKPNQEVDDDVEDFDEVTYPNSKLCAVRIAFTKWIV